MKTKKMFTDITEKDQTDLFQWCNWGSLKERPQTKRTHTHSYRMRPGKDEDGCSNTFWSRRLERGPTGSRVSFYTDTQSISMSSFSRLPLAKKKREGRQGRCFNEGVFTASSRLQASRAVRIINTQTCKQYEEWPEITGFSSDVGQKCEDNCSHTALLWPYKSSLSAQTRAIFIS